MRGQMHPMKETGLNIELLISISDYNLSMEEKLVVEEAKVHKREAPTRAMHVCSIQSPTPYRRSLSFWLFCSSREENSQSLGVTCYISHVENNNSNDSNNAVCITSIFIWAGLVSWPLSDKLQV